MRAKILVKILFLFLPVVIFAQGDPLQKKDIERIMNRFFDYHVEYKQLNNQIVNRWIKLYIKGFDPDKIYFLQEEVKPYLEISDSHVRQIKDRISKKDYSDFEVIAVRFHEAIARARKVRATIEKLLIDDEESFLSDKGKITIDFAIENEELFYRQKAPLKHFYLLHKKRSSLDTPERRARVCQLYEKKFQRREDRFLQGLYKEDLFVLYLMKSFAKSLDAHSAFFSFEEAREMRMNLEKQFEGIGIIFTESIDGVLVNELIKGGPADKSRQIHPKDLLFEINGQSVENLSFEEALERIHGDAQGRISLGFRNLSTDKPHEYRVSLQKEAISMDEDRLSYTHQSFEDGIIGTLTLNSFYENPNGVSAENDIKQAIQNLSQKGPIKGLVLDLRDNPGGFLTQAVRVAGLFVKSGVIVISKYAGGEIRYLRKVQGAPYYDGPLVILISKASASAAEIVAQALQDYGVAVIVGDERSFGKGSIQYQTVTSEDPDLLMKVSVGKYYTVSGRTTQIEGVKSDIVVPTKYASYRFGERYLEYPLPRDQVSSAFEDKLEDIEVQMRSYFAAHYLPNLQKEVTFWRKMLPTLKANSENRLNHDNNMQVLLMNQKELDPESEAAQAFAEQNSSLSKEDFQLLECHEILKDMIHLQSPARKVAGF